MVLSSRTERRLVSESCLNQELRIEDVQQSNTNTKMSNNPAIKDVSDTIVAKARAYKAQVPGMLHDHVVHMKKRVIVEGRARWIKPFFTKRFDHVAPDGSRIACIGGTQTIDRFWRTLRTSLVGRSCAVGSHAFARRIRSCQWEYWYKGEDQWVKTGEMLQALSATSP